MVLAGLGEGLGRDYSQQDTHRQGFSALRSYPCLKTLGISYTIYCKGTKLASKVADSCEPIIAARQASLSITNSFTHVPRNKEALIPLRVEFRFLIQPFC